MTKVPQRVTNRFLLRVLNKTPFYPDGIGDRSLRERDVPPTLCRHESIIGTNCTHYYSFEFLPEDYVPTWTDRLVFG